MYIKRVWRWIAERWFKKEAVSLVSVPPKKAAKRRFEMDIVQDITFIHTDIRINR